MNIDLIKVHKYSIKNKKNIENSKYCGLDAVVMKLMIYYWKKWIITGLNNYVWVCEEKIKCH